MHGSKAGRVYAHQQKDLVYGWKQKGAEHVHRKQKGVECVRARAEANRVADENVAAACGSTLVSAAGELHARAHHADGVPATEVLLLARVWLQLELEA